MEEAIRYFRKQDGTPAEKSLLWNFDASQETGFKSDEKF